MSLYFSTLFSLRNFGNCLLGFGVGGVYGAAERGRHAAPAVLGCFIFFRDSAWFLTKKLWLWGDDGDGRNWATPRPLFQERQIAKFYRQFCMAISIINVIMHT